MKQHWLLSMQNKQRNFLLDLKSLMKSLLLREEQKQRKAVQCSKRTLKISDLALRQQVLTLQLK